VSEEGAKTSEPTATEVQDVFALDTPEEAVDFVKFLVVLVDPVCIGEEI